LPCGHDTSLAAATSFTARPPSETADKMPRPRSASAKALPSAKLPEQTSATKGEAGGGGLLESAPEPLNLSLEDRIARLKIVAESVSKCRRCTLLAKTRTQTVFGVGNPQARILFVGEAPGADEDRQGEPFVGRAGKLLNDIIAACRLKREELYICNIIKCRPPENRTPLPDECANCREYLLAQLQTVDPEYIVCWGLVAAQNLLRTTQSMAMLRGRFFTYGRAKVLCTYHPSYLLRNPPIKKQVWDDMKFLFADMGVDLTKPG